MPKSFRILTICFLGLLLLSFGVGAQIQLDTLSPFTQTVDSYYIKSKITYCGVGTPKVIAISEIYVFGDFFASKSTFIEPVIPGFESMSFAYEQSESSWEPEPDMALFYANYELRFVDSGKLLDCDVQEIDLYRKRDQRLIEKSFVDQKTGVVLSKYSYDEAGQISSSIEVLAIDYKPDRSAPDLQNIPVMKSVEYTPIELLEMQKFLPWLNPESLPLPAGYKVLASTQTYYPPEINMSKYFALQYPHLTPTFFTIWISDGHEIATIDISFPQGQKITSPKGSSLEIVDIVVDNYTARIVDLPLIIEIGNLKLVDTDFSPELLFTSITGSLDIRHSESLTDKNTEPLWVGIDTDFDSFPQEALTKKEFGILAPWFYREEMPAPYSIVGFARIEYPPSLKKNLYPHNEYPDKNIIDLVIKVTDGKQIHHLGVSFADDCYNRHGRTSIARLRSTYGSIFIYEGEPMAIFSFGTHYSFQTHEEILDAYMWFISPE